MRSTHQYLGSEMYSGYLRSTLEYLPNLMYFNYTKGTHITEGTWYLTCCHCLPSPGHMSWSSFHIPPAGPAQITDHSLCAGNLLVIRWYLTNQKPIPQSLHNVGGSTNKRHQEIVYEALHRLDYTLGSRRWKKSSSIYFHCDHLNLGVKMTARMRAFRIYPILPHLKPFS